MREALRIAVVCLTIAGGAVAAEVARAATPGGPEQVVAIDTTCPTFRWDAIDGARAYELQVHRIEPGRVALGLGDPPSRPNPLLAVTVEAPATSWTPAFGQCLEPGARYVWFVRGIGGTVASAGDWSPGRFFRVASSERRPAAAPDTRPFGIDRDEASPARTPERSDDEQDDLDLGLVLARLDDLQERLDEHHRAVDARIDRLEARIASDQVTIAERFLRVTAQMRSDQDALHSRLDGVDEDLGGLDEDLAAHHVSVLPCTPEAWREDRCAGRDHPLQVDATFCFTVDLGAELDFGYGIEPGMEIELGAAWTDGPLAKAKANLEVPFTFPLYGPIGVPIPDATLEIDFGGSASLEICFAGLTFDGALLTKNHSPDEFVQQLADALEARAGEIVDGIAEIVATRELGPDRLAAALALLPQLRPDAIVPEDPSTMFQSGLLRDFIDTIPVDDSAKVLLDDPLQVFPEFDRDDPFAVCERLMSMPRLAERVEGVCGWVAGDMPSIEDIAAAVRDMPESVADAVCQTVPSLCDDEGPVSQSRRTCRRECRDEARDCKNGCGLFELQCRRSCEQRKDACLDCCNTDSDPGSCDF